MLDFVSSSFYICYYTSERSAPGIVMSPQPRPAAGMPILIASKATSAAADAAPLAHAFVTVSVQAIHAWNE